MVSPLTVVRWCLWRQYKGGSFDSEEDDSLRVERWFVSQHEDGSLNSEEDGH